MRQRLHLPTGLQGRIWHHRYSGQTFPMHRHAELEFNLVLRGTGTYLLADRRYELTRRSLVWLFPAQDHVLVRQSSDFEMWIGVFTPGLLARHCTAATDRVLRQPNPPGQYCRRLPVAAAERLGELCAELDGVMTQTSRYNAGLAYALLGTWQAYLTAADIPARGDVHPAIERAAHQIATATGPLTLEELAATAGLSPSRLSRLFKQQTGVALVDFRNRKRLERFRVLYGSGHRITMLQAALAAGFGSYPQFHRVFKKELNCSPAAYRRTQLN